MTPASSIMHWMAEHAPQFGVVGKRGGGEPAAGKNGVWARALLAPRHTAESFRLAAEAFNLAEVYQTPVILMSDLYLSEGYRTVDGFDFNVPIIRGLLPQDGGGAGGRDPRCT